VQKQAWPCSRCNRLDCKGSVAMLTGGTGEHRFAVAQRLAAGDQPVYTGAGWLK
jgi:hypothetical protein